jgi:hypothetical protein
MEKPILTFVGDGKYTIKLTIENSLGAKPSKELIYSHGTSNNIIKFYTDAESSDSLPDKLSTINNDDGKNKIIYISKETAPKTFYVNVENAKFFSLKISNNKESFGLKNKGAVNSPDAEGGRIGFTLNFGGEYILEGSYIDTEGVERNINRILILGNTKITRIITTRRVAESKKIDLTPVINKQERVEITEYTWTCTPATPITNTCEISDNKIEKPTLTFSGNGTYTIKLDIKNSLGTTVNSYTLEYTLNNVGNANIDATLSGD